MGNTLEVARVSSRVSHIGCEFLKKVVRMTSTNKTVSW